MFRRSEPHGVPERHPVIQILPKWGVAMMVCGAICPRGRLFWLTPRRFLPGGSAWQLGEIAVGRVGPRCYLAAPRRVAANALLPPAAAETHCQPRRPRMVRINVELDLPPGVELLGYERSGDGHGFEVKFPLPDS